MVITTKQSRVKLGKISPYILSMHIFGYILSMHIFGYILSMHIFGLIIQQIVTLSKYGHDALDICHP